MVAPIREIVTVDENHEIRLRRAELAPGTRVEVVVREPVALLDEKYDDVYRGPILRIDPQLSRSIAESRDLPGEEP